MQNNPMEPYYSPGKAWKTGWKYIEWGKWENYSIDGN